MTRWTASLALAIALLASAVSAHHSIAGYYDESRRVSLDGIVTQFQFVNPHPFLFIDVKDGDRTAQWRLEMDNLSELKDVGVNAGTLRAGDRVVVSGSPGRAKPNSMYVMRLDRPADGFWYEQVGLSPKIGSTAPARR